MQMVALLVAFRHHRERPQQRRTQCRMVHQYSLRRITGPPVLRRIRSRTVQSDDLGRPAASSTRKLRLARQLLWSLSTDQARPSTSILTFVLHLPLVSLHRPLTKAELQSQEALCRHLDLRQPCIPPQTQELDPPPAHVSLPAQQACQATASPPDLASAARNRQYINPPHQWRHHSSNSSRRAST